MPIKFEGLLENVDGFNGKNGFGANITISQKVEKRTKRLEFMIKDESIAEELSSMLDKQIEVELMLEQNRFGLRFGEIVNVELVA